MSSPRDFETFEEYKDTLDKEPTDPNSKKEYIVGCYTPSDRDWETHGITLPHV